MKPMFALFGRPEFLRGFHGWATLLWFVLAFPMAWLWGSSVVFVTFLSLYAIVTGHWSSWQASRVEVLQSQQMKHQGIDLDGEVDESKEDPGVAV